jgi:hypothetical protein
MGLGVGIILGAGVVAGLVCDLSPASARFGTKLLLPPNCCLCGGIKDLGVVAIALAD